MKNISKNSEFLWVETLTKILSACKISSKNDIRTSCGKKKSVLQNVFGNNIFGASILFFCCDFLNVILWWNFVSTENFRQCLHPKKHKIFICFSFFLPNFTVHHELKWAREAEDAFRPDSCIRSPKYWSHGTLSTPNGPSSTAPGRKAGSTCYKPSP